MKKMLVFQPLWFLTTSPGCHGINKTIAEGDIKLAIKLTLRFFLRFSFCNIFDYYENK